MQIQKLHIPAVVALLAIAAISASPMLEAVAQESEDNDATSEYAQGEKSHEGKDGKSCGDKNKDRSQSTETSTQA